jgi:predicted ArsR family transcriptional regulator
MDLFDYAEKYPRAPGWKRRATSREAAEAMKERAPTLRDRCFSSLCQSPKTADEVAAELGSTVLATRPRIAELVAMGCLKDSGLRRNNASGRPAIVWTLK